MSEDPEIVQAFLEESRENLDRLDRDLVELETRPNDPELLAQVYRAIHTVKGTCGFLGFHRLEAVTHAGEDVLDALRSGKLTLGAGLTTSLLHLIDAIRAVLDRVEQTGEEGEQSHDALIAELAGHLTAEAQPDAPPAAPAEPAEAVVPQISTHETSVRIDVGVLDNLMDLVGELVLTRNQIARVAADDEEGPVVAPYRQLARIATDLQENVMQARLQPVGAITGKFPRIARDLAAGMGKQIRVELEGEDVGVDRAVNEALKDALLHLVRNTVDHGIETPAERIAAGKDPEGCLRIRAAHAGGRVHIELSDDGGGADPQKLAARAVAAGVMSSEDAAALSPADALQLMFLPGLSTKEEITKVSGRGVGMDAVRSSLDQLGASIEVSSEIGQGTVFRINVPLTLAILPAVMVRSGGERYAVPQIHVREVVHLEPEEVATSVDEVDGALVHRLRGRLLPLVKMAQQLGVTPVTAPDDGMTVVVVEIDGRRFGIVVDAVGDPVEAVVKPLTRATRSITLFAGVTILSDGRPALIVDLDGLAAKAGLVTLRADEPAESPEPQGEPETSVLLATLTGGEQMAVALTAVERLEHFPCEQVQASRGGHVVEYGDTILPLLAITDLMPGLQAGAAPEATATHVPTIVCSSSIGSIGLTVERIDDVVDVVLAGQDRLVIEDRMTEVIDIETLVATAEGSRRR